MSLNCATSYSRHVTPLVEVVDSILTKHNKLLKWNQKAVSVMDIGIGDGRVAKEVIMPILPSIPQEFVGCDTSEVALDHAKSIMNLPTFQTVRMDIATSNLPPEMMNRFTNIFSSFCLHNIKNTRQAFKNIYKMLKPGGQFFVCTFSETPIDSVFEQLDKGKWSQYENFKANSPFYKSQDAAEEYRKIIEGSGFECCYVQRQPDYFLRFTEEGLNEFYTSVNPRITAIQEKDKKAYIDDYLKIFKSGKLVQLVGIENGVKILNVICKLIVAIGTKP